MVSFPPISPQRPYTPASPHPYAPHAQPISDSTFKYFIILIVSTFNILRFSWIIKCLSLMHGAKMKIIFKIVLYVLSLLIYYLNFLYKVVPSSSPSPNKTKILTSNTLLFLTERIK